MAAVIMDTHMDIRTITVTEVVIHRSMMLISSLMSCTNKVIVHLNELLPNL